MFATPWSHADNSRTPGHEVEENVNKAEGEVEPTAEAAETAADATAPEAAAKLPSAAPQQAVEEEKAATRASLSAAEADVKDTIQDAVDRTNASKSGQIGSLEGETKESSKLPAPSRYETADNAAVLPETTAKESKLTSGTFAPEKVSVAETTPEKERGAIAPASECVGETTSAVEKPEETKPVESPDSSIHAKRPYQKGIFTMEEDHKPPKMPKVDETRDDASTPAAAASTTAPHDAEPATPTEIAGVTRPPAPDRADTPTLPGMKPEEPTDPKSSTASPMTNTAPQESLGAAAAGVASTEASPDKANADLHQKEKELKNAQDKLETHEQGKKDLAVGNEKKDVEKEEKEEEKKLEEEQKKEDKKEEKEQKKEEKKEEKEEKKEEAAKATQEHKPAPAKPAEQAQQQEASQTEAAKEEAAKAERKKGGFFSWLKRKVKGGS